MGNTAYPNKKSNPASAVPVWLASGGGGVPLGYQQISAATLASATSLTVPAGAVMAIIAVDTANVRWRDDGTAPTASVGMQLLAGSQMFYTSALAAIKFILVSGSPVLNISYY